jgi:PAS domain S-box-containing protein
MKKDQTSIILDSIADGVFTIDLEWRITTFNNAAEQITGIRRKEALGKNCWEVFRANICERQCALKKTMETGSSILNQPIYIINSKGDRLSISISTAILRDENGHIIGGVETFRDLTLVEELRKELKGKHTFLDIVSKNKEMHRLFFIMEQVSRSETTVVIQGESGTGKELFARAFHSLSSRSKGPFVIVNLGAFPESLAESELFGYMAGAFTDARKDRPGRISAAEGGTLFLDEIGDLPPNIQVKLLRVLQERTYEPLGSNKTIHADIRIVAATNRDLESLVKKGIFREDLFYRINVVKLILPPLRDRKEDIPLLADHFMKRFNKLNGKDIVGISREALSLLMAYDFPGNVRELENIIEHATVLCNDVYIGTKHLPDNLKPAKSKPESRFLRPEISKKMQWRDLERKFIIETLKENNWNRKATAQVLGVGRQTLWRKMKNLNIKLP